MIETQSHELDQLSKEELITLLQQEQAKTAQLATEAFAGVEFRPSRLR